MCIDTRDCTHSCIRRIILIYLPGIHLNNTQFNSKGNKETQGACCQNVRSIEDSAELAAQDDCSHSSGVEQKKATRYHVAEMFGITKRTRAHFMSRLPRSRPCERPRHTTRSDVCLRNAAYCCTRSV